jgi:capsular polysaccharide biosynthesis protein
MTDIASVAEETYAVELCGPSECPRWIAPRGRALRHPGRNPLLRWETMPNVQIRAWRLRDVVLDATTMLLLHQGEIIGETNYLRPADELAQLRIDPPRLHKVARAGPVLVCGDAWSSNHYHFMNHTLPAIAWAASRFGRASLCLAQHWRRPAHTRMLELLNLAQGPAITLEPGNQYALHDAIFCDFTVGRADFANSRFIQSLHDRLAAAVPDGGGSGAKIYVSRLQDGHRRAHGEAELIAGLAARGFQIITPAELTLDAQIAAFRGAGLVVGPHGAGLANISFCRPQAQIYDLLPAHFVDSSILNLAIRRGTACWIDMFPGDGQTTDHLRDWQLDVPAALARVDEITSPRRWFW